MRRFLMARTAQELIARKIELESLWNSKFIEEGRVTNEMQTISRQVKEIVRLLISRSELDQSVNVRNYENHLFAS